MSNNHMYLTPSEYRRAPSGMDTKSLDYFSGLADTNAQDIELENVIRRASAWVDNITTMSDGFYASTVTETVKANVTKNGFLSIRPKNFPIVQVTDLKYRMYSTSNWSIIDPTNIQFYSRWFEVPILVPYYGSPFSSFNYGYPVNAPFAPYLSPTDAATLQDVQLTVQYTYDKGYANTFLTAAALAGATSITVDDVTTIKAGTELTIYDGATQEKITVASNPVGNTLTLQRPLINGHAAKTEVSALPSDIKLACILLVNYLLKERGVNSITLEGTTNPVMQKYDDVRDIQMAKEILRGHSRVWVV